MNLVSSINPLVLMTFFPLIGALVILFIKGQHKNTIRWTALCTALITFIISIYVLSAFDRSGVGFQEEINLPWINMGGLDIRFQMGVDGLSLLIILLTTLLTPISILSTWKSVDEHVKGFMLFFLLLETSMLGVFLALDLVLFFIFWELTLIPMIFLIGIWGGEHRVYASVKFFLFTMAGSIVMLLAIFYVAWQAQTFSLPQLYLDRSTYSTAQTWLFIAFGLAFAIKVPMWPLHTWLPDAHVEAPTAGSVILAGILLKMGTYGFLRINIPLFPEASLQFAPWIAGLAVIGILYGGMVAFVQRDVKKLVAYSSVSHLGFVMLGIFALNTEGISGAILQMINHGLSTGALFLIVGFLYERRHTRDLAAYGGIWKVMPILGALAIIVSLSSMGLPGLNGFVGEFTILTGAFGSRSLASPWFAVFATLGVILAAVYLLWMLEKVFLGPIVHAENQKLHDLTVREILLLVPILILIFWIGLYPKPFLDLVGPSAQHLSTLLNTAALALH